MPAKARMSMSGLCVLVYIAGLPCESTAMTAIVDSVLARS